MDPAAELNRKLRLFAERELPAPGEERGVWATRIL
jgi:hypothetical protein